MANNRMFLTHRPTGLSVYLGKRMGKGWYDIPDDVKELIDLLFEEVYKREKYEQDDFVIAMENRKGQPYVVDYVVDYEKGQPEKVGKLLRLKLNDKIPLAEADADDALIK
jgi:hypothetical protein